MAENHEISVRFPTNVERDLHVMSRTAITLKFKLQNELVSKRRMLLSWKVVNMYLMPDEDKTFSGSLVLDLRI